MRRGNYFCWFEGTNLDICYNGSRAIMHLYCPTSGLSVIRVKGIPHNNPASPVLQRVFAFCVASD